MRHGKPVKDISDQKFGLITVISRSGLDVTGKTAWLCRCDCGNTKIVTGLNLKTGNTRSCGCLRKNTGTPKDISEQRFGSLVAAYKDDISKKMSMWVCECDCGSLCSVQYCRLVNGRTKSCGCIPKRKKPATRAKYARTHSDKKWAAAIIRGNRNTCFACSKKGDCEAHHLCAFAKYPERRTDFSNGVCLCVECHVKFHNKHGNTGFTREDFFEFFDMPDPGDWSPLPSATWVYQGFNGVVMRLIEYASLLDDEEKDMVIWFTIEILEAEIDRRKEAAK